MVNVRVMYDKIGHIAYSARHFYCHSTAKRNRLWERGEEIAQTALIRGVTQQRQYAKKLLYRA